MTVRSDFRPKGHRIIARLGRKGRKNTMKKLNKVLVLALAVIMTLAMSASVFAQDVPLDPAHTNNATITITNAASGETYTIAKLFDATVNDAATSIAYTGTIPESLASYFTKNAQGNITKTDALDLDDTDVQAAFKAWALANPTNSAKSTGGPLNFTGLPYGYYVIVTTQGAGLITVDSTMKNATVIDKNTTPPINNLHKNADDKDVFIGQTVTYTVSFETANYYTPEKAEGATEDPAPEQIVEYTITDTPAANALNNITVTSIIVDADADTTTTDDQTTLTTQQFDSNNTITIPWINATTKENLYANGAALIVTYTGVVADTAAIDGAGNKNTVEASFKTEKETTPPPGTYTDDETIYTYAVAIKKVDQAGNALAGATFQLPFYVKTAKASDGAYVYAGTTSGTGLTNSLTTPDDGLIIIKGVQSGTY
jgi:hypothetical protein